MGNSALDVAALVIGVVVALAITGALAWSLRDGSVRRGWITAGVLFLVLTALGVVDLLRYSPRETPFSTVIVGFAVPVLGATGLLIATTRVRPWIRYAATFVVAFLLVFAGLLLGATLTRWLPF